MKEVTIHAVHTSAYNPTYASNATVHTVKGGFAANKIQRGAWTEQCSGHVQHESSRLQFAAPVALRAGEHLGIYVHALKMAAIGVVKKRDCEVTDNVIKILPGMLQTGAAVWESKNKSCGYNFLGGVEYSWSPANESRTSALVGLGRDLGALCLSEDLTDVTL